MPAWQWLLIILVVLLVILAITTIISAIFSWLFGVLGVVITAIVIAKWCFGKTIALSPRNFAVNGPPTLVIRNPVGSIRIRPGAANRVDIQGSKHVSNLFDNGNNDGAMVNYTQNGNTITVVSTGAQICRQTWTKAVSLALKGSSLSAFLLYSERLSFQVMSVR